MSPDAASKCSPVNFPPAPVVVKNPEDATGIPISRAHAAEWIRLMLFTVDLADTAGAN